MCNDSRGEATIPLLGELYIRFFGKKPDYGRLGKIFHRDLRRKPKLIFHVMCDTLKAEIVGEPYNYMQGLLKKGSYQSITEPSPNTPSVRDLEC